MGVVLCKQPDTFFLTQFSQVLPLYRKQAINRQFKSIGWFLHNDNIGMKYVKKQIFLTNRKNIEMLQNIKNSCKTSIERHVKAQTKIGRKQKRTLTTALREKRNILLKQV